MTSRIVTTFVVLALGIALSGCAAGPGHTRAAGAGIGTGAGALIGSAVAGPGNRGTGAVVGGLLGFMTGSTVGDGIASDQERYNSPPFRGGCAQPCEPSYEPCGPRRIVRRRYVRPGSRRVVYEEIIEEEIIEEPVR